MTSASIIRLNKVWARGEIRNKSVRIELEIRLDGRAFKRFVVKIRDFSGDMSKYLPELERSLCARFGGNRYSCVALGWKVVEQVCDVPVDSRPMRPKKRVGCRS